MGDAGNVGCGIMTPKQRSRSLLSASNKLLGGSKSIQTRLGTSRVKRLDQWVRCKATGHHHLIKLMRIIETPRLQIQLKQWDQARVGYIRCTGLQETVIETMMIQKLVMGSP